MKLGKNENYDDLKLRENVGSVDFIAEKWTDQLCLIQPTNSRSLKSGKLCVDKTFHFGLVKEMVGEINSNGIIGLG